MAEHTSGDWFVVEYEGGALAVHSSDEMRVCFMATAGSHGDPERIEADANLIAAAPELYRMLVAAQAALKSYQYGNASPELAEEICAAIDPVIDKVRGAKQPCGECHLQSGEVCDICGAERADG